MGTLVDLPANRAPARAVEPGHSAAILFFTGVRYYRMEEAAPSAHLSGVRRGSRRKAAPPPELQV